MNQFVLLTKTNKYFSYLFAFSMSIFIKGLPYIIMTWIIGMLINDLLYRKIKIDFILPQRIILALYFLYAIGMFWSSDQEAARFALEVKLSLLVFPIFVGLNRDYFKENFVKILVSFVLGIFVASLICLLVAVWESTFLTSDGLRFDTIDPNFATWNYGGSHFRYSNLSLFLHPTYFSIYILFALTISVLFLEKGIIRNKYVLICLKISIPLFLLMIYLLSSKAVLVSTLALLGFYIFVLFNHKGRRKIKIIYTFLSLCFIIIAVQNPRFSDLNQAIQNPEFINNNQNDGSVISRIHIWKAGIDIIKHNFFIGVGPGDTNDELVKKYESFHFEDPTRYKSNAHNQYLETFIDLGFIGIIILLAGLFFPLFKAMEKKNVLFIVFLFIIGFNFLFESFLNMKAGVIFFGFFYSLLGLVDKPDRASVTI